MAVYTFFFPEKLSYPLLRPPFCGTVINCFRIAVHSRVGGCTFISPPQGCRRGHVGLAFYSRGACSGDSLDSSKALTLVAQCSATPATVAATPPCSATPFQTQISVRHLPGMGGGKVRHQNF